MIITGNLLEIGIKNANGWGVPESGARDILSSLVGVPLKICPGAAKDHKCDYSWSEDGVIGRILSASRNGNTIAVSADVSPLAAYNIRTGKYPKHWLIFAGYQDKDYNNMLRGAKAQAVTLVDHPAYPGAGYDIAPDPMIAAAFKILKGATPQAVAAAFDKVQGKHQPQPETAGTTDLDRYYLQSWKPLSPPKPEENSAEALRNSLEKLGNKGKSSKNNDAFVFDRNRRQ